MSLEKEDLRLKMLPDMMERLCLVADVRGKDYAHQAVILLEKAIMGDYHEVSLMLERANKNRKKRERLGLVGQVVENPDSQILTIKKPDGRDQASRSERGKSFMNHQILADIELNRKIYLFQKAVEAYALNRTLENSIAVAKAKAELAGFVMEGV